MYFLLEKKNMNSNNFGPLKKADFKDNAEHVL